MSRTAAEETQSMLKKSITEYSIARNRTKNRIKYFSLFSLALGSIGVSLLTLNAYGLLAPVMNMLGWPDEANSGYPLHNNIINTATVMLLASVGVSAFARRRGYLNQFIRYSSTLSEIRILDGKFEIERKTTKNMDEETVLAVSYSRKLADAVRNEREEFSRAAKHDLEGLWKIFDEKAKNV